MLQDLYSYNPSINSIVPVIVVGSCGSILENIDIIVGSVIFLMTVLVFLSTVLKSLGLLSGLKQIIYYYIYSARIILSIRVSET